MSQRDASHVTDLVCRMSIRPEDAARTELYEGRTFHFCSAACHEQFDADRDFFAQLADPVPAARHSGSSI
jgi:P-type Cu+ transporter